MITELANVTPPLLLANSMSPFLTATLFQLLLGNVLLGVIEALVIGQVMGVAWRSIAGRVVIANYFSTVVGGFVLTILAEVVGPRVLGDEPVFGVGRYLGVMFAAALGVSWVLEWLVVRPLFRARSDGSRRSLLAVGAGQVVSYGVLMLPLYLILSSYSLGGMTRGRVAEVSADREALVYYLSPDLRSLMRLKLDGSPPERVGEVGQVDPHQSTLWMYPSEHGVDLWLVRRGSTAPEQGDRVLLKYVASAYPESRQRGLVDLRQGEGEWTLATKGDDLFVPALGLAAEKAGERLKVVVDTPFVSWNVRSVTALPGERVVFQLGQQILLMDLEQKRLAHVATGHSPVVVPGELIGPAKE